MYGQVLLTQDSIPVWEACLQQHAAQGAHTTNRVQRWPRWTRYVHLYSVLITTL
ncbi:unnamed protein product [Penicillium roqueforti FM164]|uniref:Genomic scaffold, ProqFM164S04 n=1 Tax=Penicillium roqueforti (strain FM164) TaxID=1365484 RepID=W6QHF2_PENRF|nr:unnamed protein product [Penicillium roqueforti FM164]